MIGTHNSTNAESIFQEIFLFLFGCFLNFSYLLDQWQSLLRTDVFSRLCGHV